MALRSFEEPFDRKADAFTEKIENFKFVIDRFARNSVLRRPLDELRVDILDSAAHSFESSVRLSHVCKRFRRTLVWASKHWTQYTLSSTMPPSLILGIVERCVDEPFRAEFRCNDEVGPSSDSVNVIMDLGARLADLTIIKWSSDVPPLTFPGRCRVPSLRTLVSDVLLHPSLSRSIVSLTLRVTTSLKDLLEFLLSAKNLEVLDILLAFPPDFNVAEPLESISLPHLTTLRFRVEKDEDIKGCRRLMMKIAPFTVSSLDLIHENSDMDYSRPRSRQAIHTRSATGIVELEFLSAIHTPIYRNI